MTSLRPVRRRLPRTLQPSPAGRPEGLRRRSDGAPRRPTIGPNPALLQPRGRDGGVAPPTRGPGGAWRRIGSCPDGSPAFGASTLREDAMCAEASMTTRPAGPDTRVKITEAYARLVARDAFL